MMDITSAKPPFCNLTTNQLTEWLKANGHTEYRTSQIRRWLFGKRITTFEEMHDVPNGLREQLAETYELFTSEIITHKAATDRTEKLLLKLTDAKLVECVLMRETGRRTICISTQVGCAMGCVFCASGLLGLDRNLSTGKILEQVLRLDRLLSDSERITNVVVMGIGEPLANLDALLPAIASFTGKRRLGHRQSASHHFDCWVAR